MQFSDAEIRVLGVLAEKERTTPDDYPLTRNALVRGCNQTTSRFPLTSYSEDEVDAVLSELKGRGAVRFVHQTHGRAVTRYRQVLDELLGLDDAQMAVLAALALRGPQTLVELKTRTERSHGFESLEAVRGVLDALARRDEPLAMLLGRQPGQKEARYTHLLKGEPELVAEQASARAVRADVSADVAALTERVDALEAEVARLRGALEAAVGPLD